MGQELQQGNRLFDLSMQLFIEMSRLFAENSHKTVILRRLFAEESLTTCRKHGILRFAQDDN